MLKETLLAFAAVLAVQPAVIADQDDDRVVAQLQPVESVQEHADLGIDEGDARVVVGDRLAALGFAARLAAAGVESRRRHALGITRRRVDQAQLVRMRT